MGSTHKLQNTPKRNKTKLLGLPLLILTAGLGAGLAVPAALQSLEPHLANQVPNANSTSVPEASPRASDPPRILAVLDPSTLVGQSSVAVPPTQGVKTPSTTNESEIISTLSVDPAIPVLKESSEPQITEPQITKPLAIAEEGKLLSTPILVNVLPETSVLPAPRTSEILVKRGDTLIEILVNEGTSRREAHNAIAAIKPHYDIRKLRAGQRIRITSSPIGEDLWQLNQILIKTDVDREIRVSRSDDGFFKGEELITELKKSKRFTGGEITSSLYLAATRDSVPANMIASLIRVYSYGVDFQREIHPGDSYQLLYETYQDETGNELKQGDLLYAMLTLGSRNMPLYRFKTKDGFIDYYDPKGQSIKRLLMRTPIDGARLSSRFGKRRHPILGYTKLHTGTDFAAPRGTPIMAAGDGILKYVGRKGGYGKYISIRHNSTFSTAYAHMNGYARGMKKGKRVRQGQVIGYVGTTGRSTGNHLHYEVRRNGGPVNPMGLRLPVGRELKGKELKAFKRQLKVVQATMREASAPLIAKTNPESSSADTGTKTSTKTSTSSGTSSLSFTTLPFPGRLR